MPRIGSSRAASIHLVQYLFFFPCQSHLSGSASLFVHWKIITRSHVHPKNIQTLPTFEAVNIKIAAKPGETLNSNQAEVALNRQLCFNSKAKQNSSRTRQTQPLSHITAPFKKKCTSDSSRSHDHWLNEGGGGQTHLQVDTTIWVLLDVAFWTEAGEKIQNFPHLCVEKPTFLFLISGFWGAKCNFNWHWNASVLQSNNHHWPSLPICKYSTIQMWEEFNCEGV